MKTDFVSWREKFRVRIGLIFGILFIWRAQPRSLGFLILGTAVGFAGILIRQWAAGCLIKNNELSTQGPYALVRNPLYLGSFLAAAGLILASTSFFPASLKHPFVDRSLLFWTILWVLIDSVYLPKIQKEEILLREKFGSAFDEYSSRVPALLPKLESLRHLDFTTFSPDLWKKNREYASLIGFAFLCIILVVRYHYAR